MGADVNPNIGKLNGLHSTEFQAALGPHGLLRQNTKGENLLHVYIAHVMNTFFETKWEARDTALEQAIDPQVWALWILACLTYVSAL
jgi:hypothetical protein